MLVKCLVVFILLFSSINACELKLYLNPEETLRRSFETKHLLRELYEEGFINYTEALKIYKIYRTARRRRQGSLIEVRIGI